jgi:hypothetical protein
MKRSTHFNVHDLKKSQNALFGTSSGLVGMLSLMQPTQEPKSVNYRLLFTVWRYISISKAITRAFLIFSKDSTLRQHQYAETNK